MTLAGDWEYQKGKVERADRILGKWKLPVELGTRNTSKKRAVETHKADNRMVEAFISCLVACQEVSLRQTTFSVLGKGWVSRLSLNTLAFIKFWTLCDLRRSLYLHGLGLLIYFWKGRIMYSPRAVVRTKWDNVSSTSLQTRIFNRNTLFLPLLFYPFPIGRIPPIPERLNCFTRCI